jgi:hypothetical protein
MAPDNNPEEGGHPPPERAKSESEATPEAVRRPSQGDTPMNGSSPREELKDSFDRNQLIQRNIDMALDVVLRTNPAENILKNIDDE